MSKIELIQCDCLEKMKDIENKSIDLTITSPPYDNLRMYNGNNDQWGEHIWKSIIQKLFHITKPGGVVVWIVMDATIKGSETGTSFKQALWAMECGFNLHDTMIWDKGPNASIGSLNRYADKFEYIFIFSKGKPKTANIIEDKKNIRAGGIQYSSIRQKNGITKKTTGYRKRSIKEYGRRYNIWKIFPVKSYKERLHPAPFPEKLVYDHIISWSNKNETVLDCFMGSGTTGVACKKLNRNFIGIELDKEYFKIAEERINNTKELQEPKEEFFF